MESVTTKGAAPGTIHPRFTGVLGFDIRFGESDRGIFNCALICDIFEDISGNDRPFAVVYTDADPRTKDIYDVIMANCLEADGAFLSHIRVLIISKHSRDGRTLC